MKTSAQTPTHRASFAIGDEQAARGVVDVLTEIFCEGEAAVAAFERPGGSWDITLHFAQAPDRALLREIVARQAGKEIADTIAFDTIEARDWVKTSLESLVPVPAGRFVVHGAHHRARLPANKLNIEIEAALAFGTGHHGTTRGCLLLLDHLLGAHRPQRILDLGTGTGVLAVAAAKALRRTVLASDIDVPSVRLARENARLNAAGNFLHVIRAASFSAAGIRRAWPVRPGAGEHPRQPAQAIGATDVTASGAWRAGRAVGHVDAAGGRRDRRLSGPWAGSAAASCDRWLEQPAAPLCEIDLFGG